MAIRRSKSLRQAEKKWVGKCVKYFLPALRKDRRMDGPYIGIVRGVTTNQSLIEDELEGHTCDDEAEYTGQLIIESSERSGEDFVNECDCEVVDSPHTERIADGDLQCRQD